MADEDDDKAERGGRKSPFSTLEEAVDHLTAIQGRLGLGPFGLDALAEALGHKSGVSGTARSKVGGLTHYGLLSREGKAYRVSQAGRRILLPVSPADRRAAVAEAARAPALYAELIGAYAGQPLPQLLSNVLVHNFQVNPNTAGGVADTFRRTVEYAGLLRAGVLFRTPDEPAAEAPAAPPPAPAEGPAPAPVPPPADGLASYRVPLAGGRSAVLRLPRPLAAADISRLKRWLDLSAEVLVEPAGG
jgi:hypothetical protein